MCGQKSIPEQQSSTGISELPNPLGKGGGNLHVLLCSLEWEIHAHVHYIYVVPHQSRKTCDHTITILMEDYFLTNSLSLTGRKYNILVTFHYKNCQILVRIQIHKSQFPCCLPCIFIYVYAHTYYVKNRPNCHIVYFKKYLFEILKPLWSPLLDCGHPKFTVQVE